MPRAVDGSRKKNRRKKILKFVKGSFGRRKTNYKVAKELMVRSLVFSYRDRKARKRDFRRLWITRISAFLRERDLKYSQFMNDLKKKEIIVNRKMLAAYAIDQPKAFDDLIKVVYQS